ncbi:MAG: uL30 family ribosomal protein [Nanoarchaeota archaeon]
MIVVIRISGMVEIPDNIQEMLYRMRLRQKYATVIMHETPENAKILERVRNFVAFGKISESMLEQLIEIRGERFDKKKIDAKKIASELGKKNLEELGVKPFFRLHPPRRGIDSKKHFGVGKGVLGNNGEAINKLVERML